MLSPSGRGEKADARSRGWELEVLQEQLRSVAEAEHLPTGLEREAVRGSEMVRGNEHLVQKM